MLLFAKRKLGGSKSHMPEEIGQAERRLVHRKDVHLTARIMLADGTSLPCIVRNISPMGARLEIDSGASLPPAFRLQIPDDLFTAECALQHQDGRFAGVEFTSARAEAMARYS